MRCNLPRVEALPGEKNPRNVFVIIEFMQVLQEHSSILSSEINNSKTTLVFRQTCLFPSDEATSFSVYVTSVPETVLMVFIYLLNNTAESQMLAL
jgi:hypothetical protein